MNDKEFNQLKEILDQLKNINNKLDKMLGKNEEQSPLNILLRKVTSKETTDKQYCEALVELNKLPFALSAKQFAWVVFNTPKHPQVGEAIQNFIKKQFDRQKERNEYKNQVASVLRTKYQKQNNTQFIAKLIARLYQI